ncbi:hypothetical protein PBI_MORRISSEY_55 [Gordonia phage Morrissey]|nr:hypothetical protein PBI_MORRISSEY_55 [Gordonia phage Morrissey]
MSTVRDKARAEQAEAEPTSRTVVLVKGVADIITLAQLKRLVTEAEARGIPGDALVTVRSKGEGILGAPPMISVSHDLEEPAYKSTELVGPVKPEPADYYVLLDENWLEIHRAPVPGDTQYPRTDGITLTWEGSPGIREGRVPEDLKRVKFLYRPGLANSGQILTSWTVSTLGELDEIRGINSVRQAITWEFEPLMVSAR